MTNQNDIQGVGRSKFDNWFGKHFTVFAVSVLFLVVVLGFIILLAIKGIMNETIITGFFTLLGTLAGFFISKLK